MDIGYGVTSKAKHVRTCDDAWWGNWVKTYQHRLWSVLVLQVIGSSSRYIMWIASSSESAYDCSIKPPTISKLGVLGCKIRVHISRSVLGKEIHLYIYNSLHYTKTTSMKLIEIFRKVGQQVKLTIIALRLLTTRDMTFDYTCLISIHA